MYFVLYGSSFLSLKTTAIMLLQCARLISLFWDIKSSEKARHYISQADFKNKHPVGKVNVSVSWFTLPDSHVQKVMSATFNDQLCQRRFCEANVLKQSESKEIGFASCSVLGRFVRIKLRSIFWPSSSRWSVIIFRTQSIHILQSIFFFFNCVLPLSSTEIKDVGTFILITKTKFFFY